MNRLVLLLFTFAIIQSHTAVGQTNTITDDRDGKTYPTVKIKETTWMMANLDYVTEHSRYPNDSVREAHNLQDASGRYYHFDEILDACPEGWKVASYSDWIEYFIYLNESLEKPIELEIETVDNDEDDFHRYISGYQESIDLFEEGNPLNLYPIGRWQGYTVSSSPDNPFADYWVLDPDAEYKGKAHIHLWGEFTPIHSHAHHMNTDVPEKLRRFMIRCVKK